MVVMVVVKVGNEADDQRLTTLSFSLLNRSIFVDRNFVHSI